jgi:hypothetical protein
MIETLYTYTSEGAFRAERSNHTFSSYIKHESVATDEQILELIFAACNHGSGKEDPLFQKSNVPSLSVGDAVALGCPVRLYRCNAFGWSEILPQDHVSNNSLRDVKA